MLRARSAGSSSPLPSSFGVTRSQITPIGPSTRTATRPMPRSTLPPRTISPSRTPRGSVDGAERRASESRTARSACWRSDSSLTPPLAGGPLGRNGSGVGVGVGVTTGGSGVTTGGTVGVGVTTGGGVTIGDAIAATCSRASCQNSSREPIDRVEPSTCEVTVPENWPPSPRMNWARAASAPS